jgi:hypothetical protein
VKKFTGITMSRRGEMREEKERGERREERGERRGERRQEIGDRRGERTLAASNWSNPGSFGASEKPYPGKLGHTRWNASSEDRGDTKRGRTENLAIEMARENVKMARGSNL